VSLPHGPRQPSTATPARRPGSVRRTTSVDIHGDGFTGNTRFTGRGLDLRTDGDGTARTLDQIVVEGTIAPSGELLSIDASTRDVAVGGLVGGSVRRGFRAQVGAALPEQRDAATVLHLILDDLPIALYVSGYGAMRASNAIEMPVESVARMVDLCAGWQAGATMMNAYDDTKRVPMPGGPLAPSLASDDDPLAWHDLPPVEEATLRRRRRIDVLDGDPLVVDAMFRDSHRPVDAEEDVLHEYALAATIDPATLVVLSAEATARVLPWPECPQAVASAGRAVGRPVASLRPAILAELTGIETCTHLNDTLRSLADVTSLAGAFR
jgi:hypothetical protein